MYGFHLPPSGSKSRLLAQDPLYSCLLIRSFENCVFQFAPMHSFHSPPPPRPSPYKYKPFLKVVLLRVYINVSKAAYAHPNHDSFRVSRIKLRNRRLYPSSTYATPNTKTKRAAFSKRKQFIRINVVSSGTQLLYKPFLPLCLLGGIGIDDAIHVAWQLDRRI